MPRTTDYATYAGNRNTRLTPAQRERKIAAARARMTEAMLLLKDVCADFNANSYRLSLEEQAEYRAAVDLITPLERAPGIK